MTKTEAAAVNILLESVTFPDLPFTLSACLPSREAGTIFRRLRDRDSDNPLFDRQLSPEERVKLGAAYVREKAQATSEEIMRRSSLVDDDVVEQTEFSTLKTELQVYTEFLKAGTKRIEEMDTLEDLNKADSVKTKAILVGKVKGTTWSEALEWLCEVGLTDEAPRVRLTAAAALTGTTDLKAIKALCGQGLTDDYWAIRKAAAEALKDNPDSEIQAALRKAGF